MKRKTRLAWGLSGLLTVALVSGLGVVLLRGVTVGNLEVRARLTDRWATGARYITSCGPGNASAFTSEHNMGFFAVDSRRFYHSH
jgi:hypothetical protein